MSSSGGSGGGGRTQKLKPLFSCAMFRNCTQTVLSPTTATAPPPLPPVPDNPSPPPPPPKRDPPSPLPAPLSDQPPPSSSSSSSSSTSQSFTQWRFPLHHTPGDSHFQYNHHPPDLDSSASAPARDMEEAFHVAELHLAAGNNLHALRLLERSLAATAADSAPAAACPREVLGGVVGCVLDPATARPAAKVLLALVLAEGNRRTAVEAGAAAAALEVVAGMESTAAVERALAALELMCTVPEGAAEVRGKGGGAAALAAAAERMKGRGRECALGVLAAAYAGEWAAEAPEELGRKVVAALQGECTGRGRRKGKQLLKALQENGQLEGFGEEAWG